MTPRFHIGWAISHHILIILTTLIIAFGICFAITLVMRGFYFLNVGLDPIKGWCTEGEVERTLEDVMREGEEQRNVEGNSWVEGVR